MLLALLAVLILLFVVLPLVGMALWALVTTVVVGLVIGAIARLAVPGTARLGIVATAVSGLCGSIVGGFVGQHVLHLWWLPTVLVEIGVAVVIVTGLALRDHFHRPAVGG